MSQIITVTFAEGQREAIAAQPLEQWAYGQTLQFEGLDLPQAYRVDFSNFEYCGASIPRVGGPDGVAVPVEVLTSGRNVYAFIWIQDETSGARYRRATVRVVPGPEPDTDESPEEQSAVTQAINALNAAAEAIPEQVNAAVEEAISGGAFADVFWIAQGVTTADEIYAANAAGKICLMKPETGGLGPGVLYYLTWCGVMRILGPSGETLEKRAVLTSWDGEEKTTIDILHETWSSPSTVKFAKTNSPTFTGSPKAPTAEAGTNSTQIATTAFVAKAIAEAGGGGGGGTVVIDAELSNTSTNPVQNKVISQALGQKANSADVPSKVSDLANDSGFQTASQVESAIDQHLSAVYKAAGSVASIAALPAPSASYLGYVYDVAAAFTTTSDFVEGAGVDYPAGTDVAIIAVQSGGSTVYKYDAMSGFVDLSGYIEKPASPIAGDSLTFNGAAWVALPKNVEVTISSAGEVTQAIDPGKIYHFTGALVALTITFNAPSAGQIAQYHFDFVSGASAVPLTLPSTVVLPDGWTTDVNTRYEVDVLDNYAVVASWEDN